MEVSCFLSIQRVWYIGTFVLRASSIGTDSCEISTQWVKSGGVATFLLKVESTFPILWYFRTQFFHRFWVC